MSLFAMKISMRRVVRLSAHCMLRITHKGAPRPAKVTYSMRKKGVPPKPKRPNGTRVRIDSLSLQHC